MASLLALNMLNGLNHDYIEKTKAIALDKP